MMLRWIPDFGGSASAAAAEHGVTILLVCLLMMSFILTAVACLSPHAPNPLARLCSCLLALGFSIFKSPGGRKENVPIHPFPHFPCNCILGWIAFLCPCGTFGAPHFSQGGWGDAGRPLLFFAPGHPR